MDVSNDPIKRATTPYGQTQDPVKDKKNDDIYASIEALIPESISNYHPPAEPISGKLLDEAVLKPLEVQKQDLSSLIEKAEALDFAQMDGIQELTEKLAEEQIKKILEQHHQDQQKVVGEEQKTQNFTEGLVPIDAGVEIGIPHGLEHHDLGDKMQPLVIEEAFAKYFPGLEIGVVGVNILSRGCVTLASGMMLNKIEELIKVKEKSIEHLEGKEKEEMQNEVIVLNKWLGVQKDLFNELLVDSAIMSATSLPKAGSAVVAILETGTKAATEAAAAAGNATLVSAGTATLGNLAAATCFIDVIGLGALLIRSSIAMKEAQDDKIKQGLWSAAIVNTGTLSEAQIIYEKQKAIFNERLEKNKPVLNEILVSAAARLEVAKMASPENQAKIVAIVTKQLSEAGIEIPLEINTPVQLRNYLLDPKNAVSFNEMMVRKKEMLSVSLRNAMRTFSLKKDKIDKGFLSLALTRTRAIFTTAVIVAIVVIILKILILTGVIAASAALSATGFGVLAVILGFIIIGAVYLYMKKPNIFKTYVKGVQARLYFWSIPLAVQKYRLNSSILETKKLSENINDLGLRVLEIEKLLDKGTESQIKDFSVEAKKVPSYIKFGSKIGMLRQHSQKEAKTIDEHKEILRKHQSDLQILKESKEKEVKNLEDHIAYLTGSADHFDAKVKKLQERVDVAGWKDFQRNLKKKEKAQKQAGVAAAKAPEEDYEILADFLLKDATLLEDKETGRLLSLMGIDLAQLRNMDRKELKEEVGRLIRAFFAMETEDSVDLLKKQALLQKHGLIEKFEHPMNSEAKRKFEQQQKSQQGTNGLRENTAFG